MLNIRLSFAIKRINIPLPNNYRHKATKLQITVDSNIFFSNNFSNVKIYKQNIYIYIYKQTEYLNVNKTLQVSSVTQ